jgi:hypothetical protein
MLVIKQACTQSGQRNDGSEMLNTVIRRVSAGVMAAHNCLLTLLEFTCKKVTCVYYLCKQRLHFTLAQAQDGN